MSTARPLSEASQTAPPAYPAAEALHRELSRKDTQKTLKSKRLGQQGVCFSSFCKPAACRMGKLSLAGLARLRFAGLAAARQDWRLRGSIGKPAACSNAPLISLISLIPLITLITLPPLNTAKLTFYRYLCRKLLNFNPDER